MRNVFPNLVATLVCCASLGCSALPWGLGTSPPPGGSDTATDGPAAGDAHLAGRFDVSRAWRDLEYLGAQARPVGSSGSARAREYIRAQLSELGLEPHDQVVAVERPEDPPLRAVNVIAAVPGASADVILLLAPYDSRHFESFEHLGVNDGASGAAVLLEVARQIAADPLPYTTWFVFLDGEAAGAAEDSAPGFIGSRSFAEAMSELSAFDQVRLAVFLNRVCDPDLRLARDLGSHRIYREEFWNAAAAWGHDDVFIRSSLYESPEAGHLRLSSAGLRRVVALVDTAHGGESPPGPFSGTEDDDLAHCSEKSLEAVGRVTLAGISRISGRLARIDRYTEPPTSKREPLQPEALVGVGTPAADSVAPEAAETVAAPEAAAPEAAEAAAAPEAAAPEAAEAAAAPEAAAPETAEAAAPPDGESRVGP